ncbi:hypothetical protein HG535_0D03450 [Zygotorulaspora mrakii]|uniref:Hyphally-regulated cell wall protein N-terminal domain-containing protein n=1 Tax=Zygotorulaspora mrakii TaxID=42260 RepID=A0A7H9B2B9_ZYGMR|nr:uncharacterized protein HG535_0D03450 [Zygotorulaspora mrakii]QLG72637.1 hypothetical protein HG535_0D03450 [Zygotorulaspora mrakii]
MHFSASFQIALLSFARVITAASESFGFLGIHSGTDLQFSSVYNENGNLMIGSGENGVSGIVTDDGSVRLDGNTYITVASDGTMKEGTQAESALGFSIQNGDLAYRGSEGFYAIPIGSAYLFSTARGNGSIGVLIKAVSNGQSIPDFTPNGQNGTSSSATTTMAPTSSGDSTVSTWLPNYNSTAYYPDNNATVTTRTQTSINTATETCTTCPTILPTEGGANCVVPGIAAGAVAAVAALLL